MLQTHQSSAVDVDRLHLVRPFGDVVRVGRTLVLIGDIDLATRPVLIAAATELTDYCSAVVDAEPASDAPAAATAFVDTGNVQYVDASSVSLLLDLHASLASVGVRLAVVRPCRALQRISSICGLDAVLGLDPRLGDARRTTPVRTRQVSCDR